MRLSKGLLRSLLVTIFVTGGCSSAPIIYPEHPLADQIIKPREGHEGKLTHRSCLAKSKTPLSPGQKPETDGRYCADQQIREYPLEDPTFRETVNKLDFICNIGGSRYKICKDKPGFCRFTRAPKSCVLIFCKPGAIIEDDYLPVAKYRFLLDAKTRCAKKGNYDLGF
jgi:hypothetical protein